MTMTGYTVTTTTSALVGSDHLLAARELAHACGAELEWVLALVEIGIVSLQGPSTAPGDWLFDSADLQAALDARRLELEFGVELEAAALILDLQREVRRLKSALHARGLGHA